MRISAQLDMSRLNSALDMVKGRAGITSIQAVGNAGRFFTLSLIKALPSSKAKRKPKELIDRRGRRVFGVFAGGETLVLSRKRSRLRPFLPIAYQGLAKATAYVAGASAGLSIPFSRKVGDRTMSKAREMATGVFRKTEHAPGIVFTYDADYVKGPMGRSPIRRARDSASKQLLSWSRRLMRETANAVGGR